MTRERTRGRSGGRVPALAAVVVAVVVIGALAAVAVLRGPSTTTETYVGGVTATDGQAAALIARTSTGMPQFLDDHPADHLSVRPGRAGALLVTLDLGRPVATPVPSAACDPNDGLPYRYLVIAIRLNAAGGGELSPGGCP